MKFLPFEPYSKTFKHPKTNPSKNISCSNRYEIFNDSEDEDSTSSLNTGIEEKNEMQQKYKFTNQIKSMSRPNIVTSKEPEKQHFTNNNNYKTRSWKG